MFYKFLFIFVVLVSIYWKYFYGYKGIGPPVFTNTSSGLLKGQLINVLNHNVEQYLGIPYAVPPVGSLRFAKPKPIEFQKDVIDATQPKHSCIQRLAPLISSETMSEDCLTLNIWTQQRNGSTELKPVMFWIYGGGFSIGSIYQNRFNHFRYNGSVLAAHDIVFVSVNYRLGPLGFLYGGEDTVPANVGLFDQLLALKWVRENIHLFGGDKNQITLFGESFGSRAVSAHIISPLSKGLFKRAIMESGAQLTNKNMPMITKEEALELTKTILKNEGCADAVDWVECLRKVDANRLMHSSIFKMSVPVEGTEFLPLSAQKAFNELKFNKDLDILAGVNRDEGTILITFIWMSFWDYFKTHTKQSFVETVKKSDVIYKDLNAENITEFYLKNTDINDSKAVKWKTFDFFGDLAITCPTYYFAKRYAEHSRPEINVYFYHLTHILKPFIPFVDLGVYHLADIDFVFGSALLNPSSHSKENVEFSKEVIKLWTNFAKYGKPDSYWPQLIDTKTHSSVTQIKELNPKSPQKYIQNLFEKTCEGFWKNYF